MTWGQSPPARSLPDPFSSGLQSWGRITLVCSGSSADCHCLIDRDQGPPPPAMVAPSHSLAQHGQGTQQGPTGGRSLA